MKVIILTHSILFNNKSSFSGRVYSELGVDVKEHSDSRESAPLSGKIKEFKYFEKISFERKVIKYNMKIKLWFTKKKTMRYW